MPRPTTITDGQILEAARQIFLEKGIRGTTAEVAARAGIAEGSIFNRFRTKQELFRAALEPSLEDPEWVKSLARRVGQGEVRETLFAVGLEIVEFFRVLLPLLMMSWSNPKAEKKPRRPAQGGGRAAPHGGRGGAKRLHLTDGRVFTEPNPPPVRALKQVAGFFEAEMRAGRLRRHDPEIVARAYIGGIQNHVFFELLLKAQDQLPMPAETFLRGLVNVLWSGVDPRSQKA